MLLMSYPNYRPACVGVLLLFTFVLLLCSTHGFRYDAPRDCEWQFHGSRESHDVSLTCNLRTINSDFHKANFTLTQVENTVKLRLQCSDVLFFESTLKNQSFTKLRQLRELDIEYCKIRHVPSKVFNGLSNLRKMTLRTHNIDWTAMVLEFDGDSFEGLGDLRVLDLGENNIWTFPPGLFCYLPSLLVLNLTRNRLQDVTEMDFTEGKTTELLCVSVLEELDLSSNNVIQLPNYGLTSLKKLKKLYLQHNEISSLSDESLNGLVSLQLLNMSSNRLFALPPDLFRTCRALQELDLHNNSISVLAPGLFTGLDQLLILDLSHNDLTSTWVNRESFKGLVRLVVLNLSHNLVTKLDSYVFHDLYSLQILNLGHNNIESISEDTFLTLSNLHILTLSYNNLVRIETNLFQGLAVLNQLRLDNNLIQYFHPYTFRNHSNLQVLELSGNNLDDVPEAVRELSHLKTLDLGENKITTLKNTSFIGLGQLYGLRLIDNDIGNLSKGLFTELKSLQVLNLASNSIEHIDPGAFNDNYNLQAIRLDANLLTDINNVFTDLPSLMWLNISDNKLRFFDYAVLPKSLDWLDIHRNQIEDLGNYFQLKDGFKLKMLDSSFNRIVQVNDYSLPDSIETVLLNDNVITKIDPNTFLKKANLSRVDLYGNQLKSLEFSALALDVVPEGRELPEFYISSNPYFCDCDMEWLQRINQLNLGRQLPRVIDLASVNCTLSYSRTGRHTPLLDLDPSQFLCKYDSHCFALCHCCDFDACDCEMTCPDNCTCYHDHTWSANVVDCSNQRYSMLPSSIPMDATEIYLDGNQLHELPSHAFIGKKKLRVLYLNNSGIEFIHNRTFNGVSSLKVLHLEGNMIQELHGYEFEQLEHLRELYLHNNVISHVNNATFISLKSLEVLRLDGNRLVDLPVWHLTYNSYLTRVTVSHNLWTCDCNFLSSFKSWLVENKKVVSELGETKCFMNKTGVLQEYGPVENVTIACDNFIATSVVQNVMVNTYIPTLLLVLAPCLVIFVVSILIFVFRKDMRVWAYSHYGVRLFGKPSDQEDRDKLYDAYVVYSLKDEDFVAQVISSQLEQGCAGYALCLHYRDLLTRNRVAENIMGAVESSRRVVIVLSLSFLQNEWLRPEFRSSLHASLREKKNKVILLLTTELATVTLDPELELYLKTCTVISWGEKRFWEKLRYSMPDVKKSNYDNVITFNPIQLSHSVHTDNKSNYTIPHNFWHYSAITGVPTPTPTQSTYVSDGSRKTDPSSTDPEDDSGVCDQHYMYKSENEHSYMTIDHSPIPRHHEYCALDQFMPNNRTTLNSDCSGNVIRTVIPNSVLNNNQHVSVGRTYLV